MKISHQIHYFGPLLTIWVYLVTTVESSAWPEPGLRCIVCDDCGNFDPILDPVKYSQACDIEGMDDFNCIKMIRKTGEIDRKCGREWQCKPPDKLPPNGKYAEHHCCFCDNCNNARLNEMNMFLLVASCFCIGIGKFLLSF